MKNKENNLEKKTGFGNMKNKFIQHLKEGAVGYTTIILTSALLYLPPAIAAGSLNYNKIIRHRDLICKLKAQDSHRKQFHELDKNGDGVLNLTEFCKYK